jgi:CheY-like chemotaxis protein
VVVDNGKGIPAEDLDKIWITFHTTKGVKGHSGLGLPACRLILEQLGGKISVTSKVGEGSSFMVDLPVYKSSAGEPKSESGRGKILLIDDDDGWRNFAAATLASHGYKVAVSGQGYRVDNYNQYDLILIDDILAERDSLKILEMMKEIGVISKTIAVSSNPRVERTKTRILLGIHNFFPKPYTQNILLREVAQAIASN